MSNPMTPNIRLVGTNRASSGAQRARQWRLALSSAALLLLSALSAVTASAGETTLRLIGAGATFPAPLYLRWTRDYHRLHPSVQTDYHPVSSSGGMTDLIGGRIDFAGSDLRLTPEQRAQVQGGAVELPMVAGAIVLVYNLDGVASLRLSREAVIGIFDGSIARWNDARIAEANPDVTLPDAPMTVVTRVGASGTSYSLTQHLGTISPSFADAVVTSLSPAWPKRLQQRGGLVKANGNDGVAATVRAIPGAIGYVQYAYAFLSNMTTATLENRDGKYVAPNDESFAAAVDAIRADRSVETLRDPPGAHSYPMIGVSWLIMRERYEDPAKLDALIGLIDYALGPGQQDVAALGYIPFSSGAIDFVRGEVDRLRSSPE
jgi:phosphate transport system substrate-binding protein